MSWWRPDSSYDLARPRLAASGVVMSTPYTRDELDAAHEHGRAVVGRRGPGGVAVSVELTRDEVIELARRWLELEGVEDESWGGAFSEWREDVAQTPVVQRVGQLVGMDPGYATPENRDKTDDLTTWLKVGVVVLGVLGVAWALSSVATVARAVRG